MVPVPSAATPAICRALGLAYEKYNTKVASSIGGARDRVYPEPPAHAQQ
jgi:hypothetical protein